MPNPITNFRDSSGLDLGNKLITKEYLMSVYPQIAGQLITPELWVWGSSGYGKLGNNTSTQSITPVTTFAGGANWKQAACGQNHVLAIKTDGTLWTWGANSFGAAQLGTNDLISRSTPVTTFAGGTNWRQVSGGDNHTAAIKTDGTLWVWGNNGYGKLGINNIISRSTPVTTFAGGTNWRQVSCGSAHTVAIKTDGTLWTWGNNYNGRLGNNITTHRSTPVTTFAGGTNWKQVSAGNRHTAAIKTDGTLWIWGRNYLRALGTNDSVDRLSPVTTFAGGTNWKQVTGGSDCTTAIKTDGTLWVWGFNSSNGQLGIGSAINVFIPTPVTTFAGGTNWNQVACGSEHTAAIKTDGTLWVWGSNSYGRLGDNTLTARTIPVTTFAGGTNWKQVAYGHLTTFKVAIKTSDDLQGI
jgi:alpha-tubulin suppressor-like RCC1 family protein